MTISPKGQTELEPFEKERYCSLPEEKNAPTDLVFVHICDSIVAWFASPIWHKDVVNISLENSTSPPEHYTTNHISHIGHPGCV